MPNTEKSIPPIKASHMVFEESIIHIRKDILSLEDGTDVPYYTLLTRPYSVIILAITSENRYVLTEEYRYPVKKFLLSCPGGYIDEGEDPLEAARRELLEETGYTADFFELIGSAYPYPGISEQKIFYVQASNAKKSTEPCLEELEIIRPILLTKQELIAKIAQGAELDGPFCAGLFFEGLSRP